MSLPQNYKYLILSILYYAYIMYMYVNGVLEYCWEKDFKNIYMML